MQKFNRATKYYLLCSFYCTHYSQMILVYAFTWQAQVLGHPENPAALVVQKRINHSKLCHRNLNLTVSFAEFYDDDNGFGIVRKGKQHLSSDFLFEFIAEVICADSRSSGYMINLMPVQDDLQYKRLVIKAS